MQDLISMTPEEIGQLYDRNESFHGTEENFEKLSLYRNLQQGMLEFIEQCADVVQLVSGYDPNGREKHAILWMEFSPAASLSKEDTAALTALMEQADGTVFSSVGDHVRISFEVNNIWND